MNVDFRRAIALELAITAGHSGPEMYAKAEEIGLYIAFGRRPDQEAPRTWGATQWDELVAKLALADVLIDDKMVRLGVENARCLAMLIGPPPLGAEPEDEQRTPDEVLREAFGDEPKPVRSTADDVGHGGW